MTKYEKLCKQRDLCQSAMIRTDGEMKAIWEAKYTYFQGIIDKLTIEEAEEEVNG